MLGVALRDPVAPIALVIAFCIGNLPAALSSTTGMRAAGRSYAYVEAVHDSPRFSGLLAAVGFGLLLLVDATTR